MCAGCLWRESARARVCLRALFCIRMRYCVSVCARARFIVCMCVCVYSLAWACAPSHTTSVCFQVGPGQQQQKSTWAKKGNTWIYHFRKMSICKAVILNKILIVERLRMGGCFIPDFTHTHTHTHTRTHARTRTRARAPTHTDTDLRWSREADGRAGSFPSRDLTTCAHAFMDNEPI